MVINPNTLSSEVVDCRHVLDFTNPVQVIHKIVNAVLRSPRRTFVFNIGAMEPEWIIIE